MRTPLQGTCPLVSARIGGAMRPVAASRAPQAAARGLARLAASFMVLALLSAAAFAQAGKTASDKRARKVIDEAVAALGGDKFLTIEDRVESGRAYSFYRDELSGLSIAKIYTRYLTVTPSKSGEDLGLRERQAFGKDQDTATVFREDEAVNINWRGAKPVPKEQFARYKDSTLRNIFYILRQRLNEPGLNFESRGLEVMDYQPTEVVDIIDSENRVTTVYFHQSTKLPVAQKYSSRDPQTKERNDEVTRFGRYRDNGGIQWPQQITRERNGEKIFQIFSESVTFNQDLTDDLFSTLAVTRKK